MQEFFSHGKLLLTGEYVVLDGATALALPTKKGQHLHVKETKEPFIKWKSLDHLGKEWFKYDFLIQDILSRDHHDLPEGEVAKMLFLSLVSAAKMNRGHFEQSHGFEVTTQTEFPSTWGLGSSSTLLGNIAKWCNVNAFRLLEGTFGGSGYDIAVALEGTPITFEKSGAGNSILKTSFDPVFKDHIFFVHLNQKQDSRQSIAHYRAQEKQVLQPAIEKISALTHQMITCTSLSEFNLLLEIHENIISQLVGLKKVKTLLFNDFKGSIKSLGGWGGDFILATGTETDMNYFRQKGYSTILSYNQMIL